MRKRIIALFTAGLLTFGMIFTTVGCTSTAGGSSEITGDTIRIGTSFPLSGTLAQDGEMIMDAINLAAKQWNDKGGINGKEIEIVSEDDEANPTTAASVANKFADDSTIAGVITSYNSSCCLAQVPIYEDATLPSISPVATSPDLTGASPYFYRVCVSDSYVGTLAANLATELGYKTPAVLFENDDYGMGLKDCFAERIEANGGSVAFDGNFVLGETKDFKTLLTSIKQSNADCIFIAGFETEALLIANQAKELGINLPIVGGDGIYSSKLLEDSISEGMYTLGAFTTDSTDENVQTFISSYKEVYGSEPGNWAALAYDAANTMFEAINSCGDDLTREAINEALTAIDYTGVTGENKFVDGDVEKEYLHFVVKDGKFEIIQ